MTIWGSSGGFRNGLTGLQEWTRIDNEIRDLNGGFGMQMRRSYQTGLPATFNNSEMAVDYGKRTSSWTFAGPSWATVASGSLNTDIIDFAQSIPVDHLAYIGYFHEPEDDVEDHAEDWEEWRDAQYQFLTSVIAAGMDNVIPTFCLMSWTANPGSGRNVDHYDPYLSGTFDRSKVVVGQDGYGGAGPRFPYAIYHYTVAEFRGRGYQRQAIWECGVGNNSSRSEWFAALEQYADDDDIEVINYFHSDTNPDPSTDCWLDLETYDSTALDTWAAIIAGNQDIEIPEPEPSAETRVSNTIWVYPQTDPEGGFIGSGPIGEDDTTETNTDWYIDVRDFFDPDTIHAKLFSFKEFSFTKSLNDTGFGELVISRDDPFTQLEIDPPEPDVNDGKGILQYPLMFSFVQNGAERFRMIYDGKNKDRARTDAAEEIVLSGTGLAEALSWGVVLPFGWPTQTKARARKCKDTAWTAGGGGFVKLFTEAQDRGEIPDWLSLGFTAERDSYGNRWETVGDREIEIGSSLLDVITTAADSEEFDWIVTSKGVVHAAPILGADLTKQVRFFNAVTNNEVGAVEDRKDLRTVAYVEGVAGRISKVISDRGTERWGKRAIYLRSEEASSERQRNRVGHGTLRQTKHPTRERTVTVPYRQTDPDTGAELPGRTAFIDYAVGDLIGLGPRLHPDTLLPLGSRDVRVQELGVRVTPDSEPQVELALEHRLERHNERVRRLLKLRFGQWSNAKAAREGKVPVANLRDTDAEFPNAGDALIYDPDANDGEGFWKNGKPIDCWDFWYNAPITSTVVSKMYVPVDAVRTLRRITMELGDRSTSGAVSIALKRNESTVATMSCPAGERRERQIINIPCTEDDRLSVDITGTGTGAGFLQVRVEAG